MFDEPRTWWRNALVWIPLTSVLYVGYQVTNRFHLVDPMPLPMSGIDRDMPFLLWTVWPYFVLIGALYLPLWLRDGAVLRRACWALVVAVCCNLAIWTLAPTTFPRPPTPEGDSLTHLAYRWLVGIDTPANCFPSGHITSATIGCWALAVERPRWRWSIWSAFAVLALSVLTTRQHYAIDILGGMGTAGLGIALTRAAAAPAPERPDAA